MGLGDGMRGDWGNGELGGRASGRGPITMCYVQYYSTYISTMYICVYSTGTCYRLSWGCMGMDGWVDSGDGARPVVGE